VDANGAISAAAAGIQLNHSGGGLIGSQIFLRPDALCGTDCLAVETTTVPEDRYIAASVQGTPVAVVSVARGDVWKEAIAGCDQTTVYACGTVGGATADLSVNLGGVGGDTVTATQALIHSSAGGEDALIVTSYPFQIEAGLANPLVSKGIVNDNDVITSSDSIATIPLMENLPVAKLAQPPVTIVGFLQVFIESVSNAPLTAGRMTATILNVSGCSNTSPATSVTGSSPVPVRLINYP
jgi:hypothetical protein